MGLSSAVPPPLSEVPQHRRNKSSTSVLKSIILPKNKKGQASSEQPSTQATQHRRAGMPFLPPDHPHSSTLNADFPRPADRHKENRPTKPGLHKKTKSTTSLRGFGGDKKDESKVLTEGNRENGSSKKPRKSKSSTSLATIFGKSRSGKTDSSNPKKVKEKDKENTSPPATAVPHTHTPIWAEFSSQPFHELTTTTNIPLNDQSRTQREIDLFTPKIYTPSKQRNFHDVRPVLAARAQRPMSELITGEERMGHAMQFAALTPASAHRENVSAAATRARREPPSSDRRGSRVMNFVAQFNERAQIAARAPPMTAQELRKLEADFEAVLDKRQIPEATRDKMRTMNPEMKQKFIRAEAMPTTPTESEQPQVSPKTEGPIEGKKKHSRTRSGFSTHSFRGDKDSEKDDEEKRPSSKDKDSSKKRRPRSRTFTFSKGDLSPSKKSKGEGETMSKRSSNVPKSPSTTSLASIKSSASGKEKKPKPANPKEFVKYLREVQRPQDVEVGKMHKLRLLIRNETVEWVDMFISEGGMMEIVALLHRIMKIEWREEHDDQLLHETLLCLKGLCTTALALRKLCDFERELFPALLGMLFDEEHKGPSEFTTRTIIINIIFTHLSSAPANELEACARKLLGYLQDPSGPDDKKPLPFIMEMHKPRPYRVWCKEVVNVTKEVFWIFLHHLNTVPLPKSGDAEAGQEAYKTSPDLPYSKRHFPAPRPPVPAAPYVGGVEWDATNYMASHLDLLNGIIASLPTLADRVALREELRASGWEKLMGQTLRTCKEKFYGAVHDGLRTWVAAAADDGWEVYGVRTGKGEGQEDKIASPRKSPRKKKDADGKPPRLDLDVQPKEGRFDVGIGLGLSLAEAHHKWRDAQREAGQIRNDH